MRGSDECIKVTDKATNKGVCPFPFNQKVLISDNMHQRDSKCKGYDFFTDGLW